VASPSTLDPRACPGASSNSWSAVRVRTMSDLDAVYEQRLLASPRRPASENHSTANLAVSPRRVHTSPVRGSPLVTKDVISDRFIPSRGGTNLQASFALLPDEHTRAVRSSGGTRGGDGDGAAREDAGMDAYSMLLKSELLGCDTVMKDKGDDKMPASPQKNLFRFKSSRMPRDENAPYSRSLVGLDSHRLLASPRKTPRKISTVPYKVLDAPALQDDFYLNLVDWSSLNVLAVGLGNCVYLWSACTSKVTKLCDLSADDDNVTSVSWTGRGTHLAVGTNRGEVQIWEASKIQKVRSMTGHSARVGTLSWSGHTLSSGSRDRSILHHDVRVPQQYLSKLSGHRQEVCGLKWSADGQQLASGGNDNKLFVWNMHSTSPVLRYNDHTAAVKVCLCGGNLRRSSDCGMLFHPDPLTPPPFAPACAHHVNAGDRVVAAPKWPPRLWGRNCGQVHSLLEHHDQLRPQLRRHRLAGVQPQLVEEHQRAREHARIFAEPDRRLAVPHHVEGGHPNGPHAARAVPRPLARLADDRHRGWRRDAQILEHIPRTQDEGRQQRFLFRSRRVLAHPLRA